MLSLWLPQRCVILTLRLPRQAARYLVLRQCQHYFQDARYPIRLQELVKLG